MRRRRPLIGSGVWPSGPDAHQDTEELRPEGTERCRGNDLESLPLRLCVAFARAALTPADLPLFRDIYSTNIGKGLFMLTLSSAGPILAFTSIESLKAGPKLPGLAWLPFLSFVVGQIYGPSGSAPSARQSLSSSRLPEPRRS